MSKKGLHGGAWKVAYADFVTAMMALFLVLWLTAQDREIREQVERAFRPPFPLGMPGPGPFIPKPIPGDDVSPPGSKGRKAGAGNSPVETELLRRLQSALALPEPDPQEPDKPIELELTADGLRVCVFNRARRPIFEPQSVDFTPYGEWVFTTLAWTLASYPSFDVELEGHTEAGSLSHPGRADYGKWEISADRANAARRKLIHHGLAFDQIRRVGGYADKVPLPNRTPSDESNSRVTVTLRQKQGI